MPAFEIQEREPRPAFAIRLRSTVEEISSVLPGALGEAWQAADAAGLAPDGPPYTRYLSDFDAEHPELDYEAGVTLPKAAATGAGRAIPVELPGGTVAVGWHIGPYATIAETYEALMRWIVEQGRRPAGPMWEVYWSDPHAEPDPTRWRTEVIIPVA